MQLSFTVDASKIQAYISGEISRGRSTTTWHNAATNTLEPCYNVLLGIQEKSPLYRVYFKVREFLIEIH